MICIQGLLCCLLTASATNESYSCNTEQIEKGKHHGEIFFLSTQSNSVAQDKKRRVQPHYCTQQNPDGELCCWDLSSTPGQKTSFAVLPASPWNTNGLEKTPIKFDLSLLPKAIKGLWQRAKWVDFDTIRAGFTDLSPLWIGPFDCLFILSTLPELHSSFRPLLHCCSA